MLDRNRGMLVNVVLSGNNIAAVCDEHERPLLSLNIHCYDEVNTRRDCLRIRFPANLA